MLEKKCVLLLYGKGRYDTSIKAIKEYLVEREDCYVIALSDADLYSFKRYKMGFHLYKASNRNLTLINRLRVQTDTMISKYRTKNSAKNIKPYSVPKNPTEEFFYSLASPYRQLFNVIARYKPDVVLCATPKLLRDAVKVKYRGRFAGVSVAGLLTDYTLDNRFVNYKVNYYFVQNQDVADRLISFGIDSNKIKVVGTPLPKCSIKKYDREKVLEELGIDNDKGNIVLVGGRYGSDTIKNTFTGVVESNLDANIIVMIGDNQGLLKYCTLVTRSKKAQDRVVLVEDIDDFSKMYAVADILVTSPTASITYEAIYHNKNIIVCKGLDRIESGNGSYLLTNGLALNGRKYYELVESLTKIVSDEETCAKMAINRKLFLDKNATDYLGEMIEKIANHNYQKKLDIQQQEITKIQEAKKQKQIIIANALPNDDIFNND